ncbi:uncharacterized protein B0H18DRAFT_990655 [Fomitopsis serialis]|uniref:uncharacterized protein n=1 Tax=Fomitopsis serialis TaxID=139415 RepID=UPI00200842A6|nr:uncharacterized protein B0H18DRAFT_1065568 [Neoantrodia serialis]XP_047887908.1 uncharacterized protein B0H18DRAFT_1037290 [Neoantrodia serialis]XP_047896498.1 uncharacterized protein B0H18DRAFT_990655 [Neoantrodia serialis]KAH9910903.1 hypothetical protein B0H18DRAFT_1065568 [Neoantrodia serialis]KAH9916812.1 hypothetical protein B0H18DRAFT_1037290 [Neoantrodia serialis]KAH9931250.1 hypothetical protein B0H18DRAFT_990655 [Neoantrodia serialis]
MPHPQRAYPYPWVVLPVSYPGSLWVGVPRWSLRGFGLVARARRRPPRSLRLTRPCFLRAIRTPSHLLGAVPTPTARSSAAFVRGALALCARGRRVPHTPALSIVCPVLSSCARAFVGRVCVLGGCPAHTRSACAPARPLVRPPPFIGRVCTRGIGPWVHVVAFRVAPHVAAAFCAYR